MVLGKPVAPESELLGHLDKIHGVAQRSSSIGSRYHRNEVKDPEWDAVVGHANTGVVALVEDVGTGLSPRWSRSVGPSYSRRKRPASWRIGTTVSANSSSPPGVTWGTR